MLIRRRNFYVLNSMSNGLRYVMNKWPGKKLLKEYRFLPIFFVLGGALEFSMINWHVGQVNFYNTYKKRQIETAIEEKLARKARQQLKQSQS